MRKHLLLIVTLFGCNLFAQNLITNPDFSASGGSIEGWETNNTASDGSDTVRYLFEDGEHLAFLSKDAVIYQKVTGGEAGKTYKCSVTLKNATVRQTSGFGYALEMGDALTIPDLKLGSSSMRNFCEDNNGVWIKFVEDIPSETIKTFSVTLPEETTAVYVCLGTKGAVSQLKIKSVNFEEAVSQTVLFSITEMGSGSAIANAGIKVSGVKGTYFTNDFGDANIDLIASETPYEVSVLNSWNNVNTFDVTIKDTTTKVNLEFEDTPEYISICNKLDQRKEVVHTLTEDMRDPFITIGPDNNYYLTYTIQEDDREGAALYTSPDLKNWTKHENPFTLSMTPFYTTLLAKITDVLKLWAPEFHYKNGKWIIVHTTNVQTANLLITAGGKLEAPYTEWGEGMGRRHDPSIFTDTDDSHWLVWGASHIRKIKSDFSSFNGDGISIKPSNRNIGHEGSQIIKVGDKYVLFGTAWSRDEIKRGTYNLYYCTSDNLSGPYGVRRYAAKSLGHGTVFKDKDGNWWCTGFANGGYKSPLEVYNNGVDPNVPTTLNKSGLTLVPMEIKEIDGDVWVRSLDTLYNKVGDEEIQDFTNLGWPEEPNGLGNEVKVEDLKIWIAGENIEFYITEPASINIYNMEGKKVLSKTIAAGTSYIQKFQLNQGIYIVQYVSENGLKSKKVVVR